MIALARPRPWTLPSWALRWRHSRPRPGLEGAIHATGFRAAAALGLLGLALLGLARLRPAPPDPGPPPAPPPLASPSPAPSPTSADFLEEGEASLLAWLEGTGSREALPRAEEAFRQAARLGNYPGPSAILSFHLQYLAEELGHPPPGPDSPAPLEDPVSYGYLYRRRPGAEGLRLAARDIRDLRAMRGDGVLGLVAGGAFGPGRDEPWTRMLDRADLGPGQRAADIAGGTGRLAWLMQRRVGPSGRVYLSELDWTCEKFVDYVRQHQPAYRELRRVRFVRADRDRPNLPEPVDVITLSELHLLRDAEWKDWGRKWLAGVVRRDLVPGGRVGVMETFINTDVAIRARSTGERWKILKGRLRDAGLRVRWVEPDASGWMFVAVREPGR